MHVRYIKKQLLATHTITYLRAMYLYNATIIAENEIGEAIRTYLSGQLADGVGNSEVQLSFLKMLDSPHEGVTYCIQLRADNRDAIAAFQETRLTEIRAQIETTYVGKVLFFDSIMKYINL